MDAGTDAGRVRCMSSSHMGGLSAPSLRLMDSSKFTAFGSIPALHIRSTHDHQQAVCVASHSSCACAASAFSCCSHLAIRRGEVRAGGGEASCDHSEAGEPRPSRWRRCNNTHTCSIGLAHATTKSCMYVSYVYTMSCMRPLGTWHTFRSRNLCTCL
eukprot:COSAG01_NODE_7396_length_3224_cov_2.790250_1_plen_157_part_00